MKITLNRHITALAVSIFIMTAPMAQGMGPVAAGEKSGRTEFMSSTTVRHKLIILAENEKVIAEDKTQKASGTQRPATEPESGPKTDNNEQPVRSRTAPLKPFRPSEEIAAEQAVDFPADI